MSKYMSIAEKVVIYGWVALVGIAVVGSQVYGFWMAR